MLLAIQGKVRVLMGIGGREAVPPATGAGDFLISVAATRSGGLLASAVPEGSRQQLVFAKELAHPRGILGGERRIEFEPVIQQMVSASFVTLVNQHL